MKKTLSLLTVLLFTAALLAGCAGMGYDSGYRGNVSTTDDGFVNGTNEGMYADDDVYNDPNRTHRSASDGGTVTGRGADAYGSSRTAPSGSSAAQRANGTTGSRSVPGAIAPSQQYGSAAPVRR